jgi:hypothetical protein
MRDGDREYSLQAFNDLIQEAVILIEEDELTGESEGERRIGMDYMAGGMEGELANSKIKELLKARH